ncbi:MAG: 3',5'-cyclic-nucleotide phosphodiesterase [Thiomicrospira sp.]|nr:MAG: 3',5'-cyclic-nucleotide phosphodiesterase [Thiomicrospira sp.]
MQLRILGCSGGISPGQGTTAFLVDQTLLVDAGTGVESLTYEEMQQIEAIVLTHSHLDHISHLPFLLKNLIGSTHQTLQVYALSHTVDALKNHIFNDVIWPDFTVLPSHDSPCVQLNIVKYGEVLSLADKQVVVLPAYHSVPTAGYWIGNEDAAFAFSGDCFQNNDFWRALNNLPPVDMLIMDNQFSKKDKALSELAKHYYPSALKLDLEKLDYRPPVFISHLPVTNKEKLLTEIRTELARWTPEVLEANHVYNVIKIET